MKFISQDDITFEIDNEVLRQCTKICNTDSSIVKLTSTKSKILQKVIQYCEMHLNDFDIPEIQKPIKYQHNIFDIVSFKDAQFITNLEFEEIIQIIQAAKFLGINTLIDLSCAYIAIKIRGKNSQQVKEMLKSNKPITDEQEQMDRDMEIKVKK
ncbi:unnamed protein product [Paramecium sonneborni]|uniref:SKP1-like protein n=1 Tax=Paramecium sonneborni TaxID=65129 RepID=A0A8S1MHY6_9CILI|nr:unnamed protein product [Paramecium sonneborni]